ncbi:MAG: hypothetical protein QNJ31_01275 [Candidatus Caenarcaniphilales bacterium]|nr:hypothetical protein [Candidatus Caenarcaniphilales bacterium]
MNLKFQGILDKNNKIEISLQELELLILNSLGLTKFNWTNVEDLKRKYSIELSLMKVRGFLENSLELRENVKQLNREYLRIQLSAKNLESFAFEIEERSKELKEQLLEGGLLDSLSDSKALKLLPSKTFSLDIEKKEEQENPVKNPETMGSFTKKAKKKMA